MPSKKYNDSDSDSSTDSKGNIRDLIDYSTSEDKKPRRSKRKAAIVAQKRIDDIMIHDNQKNKVIYPKMTSKRNITPSKRKYNTEQHALFDEMMESSEGSDYEEEEEELEKEKEKEEEEESESESESDEDEE